MKLQILGCGSSTGVPIVGCHCPVCSSRHPFNNRTRPAAVLHMDGGQKVLFDCSPDLRQQSLNFGLERVDAVLLTHLHADHIMGVDELRVFNYLTHKPVDLYGYPEHVRKLRQMFPYIFQKTVQQGRGQAANRDPRCSETLRPLRGNGHAHPAEARAAAHHGLPRGEHRLLGRFQ